MVDCSQDIVSVLDQLHVELAELGVRRYALFGSFLHGDATDESDVDILVEFMPDAKTFTNYSNLVFMLEEAVGRSVEVVTKESLSPYIGPHIMREVEYVSVSS